jgi:type III restriction enzyme
VDVELLSDELQNKLDVAASWANHVNADPAVKDNERYLLVSETDINDAKGSREALKKLGG